MRFSDLSLATFLPLIDLTAKIAALIILAAIATALARRAAAATRHLIWLCALTASLALPAIGWFVPVGVGAQWQIPAAPRKISESQIAAVPQAAPPAIPAAPTVTPQSHADAPPAQTPAPVIPPKSVPAFALSNLLCDVYALGVGWVALQLCLGAVAVRRIVQTSRIAARESAAATALEAAVAEAGVRNESAITLRLAPNAVPMTWGWHRPTILLPDEAENWDVERLRVVLLHELAHIVRRDWPVQMFVHLVCAAYWFHPLVWWAASRLRAEGERACDDRVLLAGVASDVYAAHLLAIAQLSAARCTGVGDTSTVRFSATMARPAGLEQRLAAITARSVSRHLHRRYVVTVLTLFALVILPINLLHLTTRRVEDGKDGNTAFAAPGEPLANQNKSAGAIAKPDTSLAFYRVPQDKQWTRDAGSGVTIELVGISQCGNPQGSGILSQSWRPNGVRFERTLYASSPMLTQVGDSDQHGVEFAFRLHSTARGMATINSDPKGATSVRYGTTPNDHNDFEGQEAFVTYCASTGGLRATDAFFPSKTRATTLRVSVAAGPWQQLESLDLRSLEREKAVVEQSGILQNTIVGNRGEISFGTPMHGTNLENQPHYGFVVTDTAHVFDCQIAARDAAGAVHYPDQITCSGTTGGGFGFRQTTVWFDEDHLPFAKLKELRFNIRPFRTVEFRNVSLYPKEVSL